jgi:hypothetical protein
MARPSLAELQKTLKEKTEKKTSGFTSDYYPFHKMEDGQEVELRLLPDADEENPHIFSLERNEHVLNVNGEDKRIPCLKMYGEDCPICERSSKYYKAAKAAGENTKGDNLGPNAKKGKYYLRKTNTLVRALVLKDPLPEGPNGSYKGKVATFNLGFQIMDRLVADLSQFGSDDGEPWDLDNGYNFIIKKGRNGAQASYTASGFARKATAVPEEYRDNAKLIALSSLLSKNPGLESVLASLEAHDNGTEYSDKGSQEKPKQELKSEEKSEEKAVQKQEPKSEPKPEKKEEPVKEKVSESAPASSGDDDEDDVLARIRNRNKK